MGTVKRILTVVAVIATILLAGGEKAAAVPTPCPALPKVEALLVYFPTGVTWSNVVTPAAVGFGGHVNFTPTSGMYYQDTYSIGFDQPGGLLWYVTYRKVASPGNAIYAIVYC